MKNLWKARFILPILLVGLGAAWLIHERVRLTRDRWMLDIMVTAHMPEADADARRALQESPGVRAHQSAPENR